MANTSLAVAIRSDERLDVFGDYSRIFAVGDCNCGCVQTPVKKPDDWAIPPSPKVEREDSTILLQGNSLARRRHHSNLLARLLKRRCSGTAVSSSQLRPRCLGDCGHRIDQAGHVC